jgi:hypothetical protein
MVLTPYGASAASFFCRGVGGSFAFGFYAFGFYASSPLLTLPPSKGWGLGLGELSWCYCLFFLLLVFFLPA